jgi:hypothetical protein
MTERESRSSFATHHAGGLARTALAERGLEAGPVHRLRAEDILHDPCEAPAASRAFRLDPRPLGLEAGTTHARLLGAHPGVANDPVAAPHAHTHTANGRLLYGGRRGGRFVEPFGGADPRDLKRS